KITNDQLSLPTMIDYFQKNPSDIEVYTSRNPRYVFFRKEEGQARGSLNEPVTPMRTIATDKSIFPRASLTFVMATLPKIRNNIVVQDVYSGFAMDQDTGGAIRAPGRCDFYMGVGQQAGQLAGRTRKEGKLYYLFLKENPNTLIY
ncbi:MAG: MltA domain-containing protein, partial [Planctomycetota bacterium]